MCVKPKKGICLPRKKCGKEPSRNMMCTPTPKVKKTLAEISHKMGDFRRILKMPQKNGRNFWGKKFKGKTPKKCEKWKNKVPRKVKILAPEFKNPKNS